jgi:isopenicillin-N epimerase
MTDLASNQLQPFSRRTLLGGFGALGAASFLPANAIAQAGATGSTGAVAAIPVTLASDAASYFAAEEPFFMEMAKEFTLDPKVVYFMAAQKGSMPKAVLARMKEGLDKIAADPFPVYLEPSAKTREAIAKSYGTTTDQIAITRNTTDALTLAMMGIDWKPGDEILISPLEHPTGITLALRIAARYGVVIRQWGIPVGASVMADEVIAALEKRVVAGKTKVIFFSSPLWPTGMRLPESKIAAIATRAGAITVVDGAHYNGMIDPKLDETGIDFFALCGHKWQCGPGGTGLLYVRNKPNAVNGAPPPRFHIVRSQARNVPFDGSRGSFDIGAALSMYGFPETADWRSLGDSIAMWDKIGRGRIETWHMRLGGYFCDRLAEAFGPDAVLRPVKDPALQSGIIGFNPFPRAEQKMDNKLNTEFRASMLKDYQFRISGLGVGQDGLTRGADPETRMFPIGSIPNRDPDTLAPRPMAHPQRVNACLWNNRQQIDNFVAATKDLVAKMTA